VPRGWARPRSRPRAAGPEGIHAARRLVTDLSRVKVLGEAGPEIGGDLHGASGGGAVAQVSHAASSRCRARGRPSPSRSASPRARSGASRHGRTCARGHDDRCRRGDANMVDHRRHPADETPHHSPPRLGTTQHRDGPETWIVWHNRTRQLMHRHGWRVIPKPGVAGSIPAGGTSSCLQTGVVSCLPCSGLLPNRPGCRNAARVVHPPPSRRPHATKA
jgi:hypothetical protein